MSGTDTSAPFISDPAGSFAEQAREPPISSTGETIPWLDTAQQLIRGGQRLAATYGYADIEGMQAGQAPMVFPPEATVQPDVLNDKYSIPGKLTFDSPLPDSVASSMYSAKREELMRQDAVARRPSGIISGATDLGAGFMAGLLDPVNLAATFVPGLPELDLGAGVAARTAGRAIAGAGTGAIGMAPLVGLKFGLSRQDQSDYDGYNAMADLAVGAGIGVIAHVGGGLLGDWLSARVRNSPQGDTIQNSPEARQAALSTAIAQMAEDRPVEIRPVLDAMTDYTVRSNASEVTRAQIISLQREADALRSEAGEVPNVLQTAAEPETMLHPPQPDLETQARQEAILDEVTDPAKPVTSERRAELMHEYDMLQQGAAPGSELEQARSTSQRQGLLIAAERIEQRIEQLQSGLTEGGEVRPLTGALQARELGDPSTPAIRDAALRSAAGEQPPSQTDLAADAASKETSDSRLKLAQQQTDDNLAFLKQAQDSGALTQSVMDELQGIHEQDAQAEGLKQTAATAAACVARGAGYGA